MITPIFFARNPAREVFDVGPFVDPDNMANEAQELMKLPDGATFEIGEIVPFVPFVPTQEIVLCVAFQSDENQTMHGKKWRDRVLSAGTDDLEAALDLALQGWLATHDLLPRFGSIKNVKTFRVTSAGTAEPEQ